VYRDLFGRSDVLSYSRRVAEECEPRWPVAEVDAAIQELDLMRIEPIVQPMVTRMDFTWSEEEEEEEEAACLVPARGSALWSDDDEEDQDLIGSLGVDSVDRWSFTVLPFELEEVQEMEPEEVDVDVHEGLPMFKDLSHDHFPLWLRGGIEGHEAGVLAQMAWDDQVPPHVHAAVEERRVAVVKPKVITRDTKSSDRHQVYELRFRAPECFQEPYPVFMALIDTEGLQWKPCVIWPHLDSYLKRMEASGRKAAPRVTLPSGWKWKQVYGYLPPPRSWRAAMHFAPCYERYRDTYPLRKQCQRPLVIPLEMAQAIVRLKLSALKKH